MSLNTFHSYLVYSEYPLLLPPLQLNFSQIALTEDTDSYSYSHQLPYPPSRQVRVLPGRMSSSVAIVFNISILDSKSREIERSNFIPFAPLKCEFPEICHTQ